MFASLLEALCFFFHDGLLKYRKERVGEERTIWTDDFLRTKRKRFSEVLLKGTDKMQVSMDTGQPNVVHTSSMTYDRKSTCSMTGGEKSTITITVACGSGQRASRSTVVRIG